MQELQVIQIPSCDGKWIKPHSSILTSESDQSLWQSRGEKALSWVRKVGHSDYMEDYD